jgi:TonB family protein
MLSLGSRINGLTGEDVPPWHLKASFKVLDEKGSVTDSGTWEEFWTAPNRFKRTYAGTAFKVTEFGTANGPRQSGDKSWPSWLLTQLRTAIVNPLPSEASLQEMDLETKDTKADRQDKGSADLVCFNLKPKPTALSNRLFPDAVYCFDAKDPFLRTRGLYNDGVDTTANNPVVFHNRLVASNIFVGRGGKLVLAAHLESIEDLARTDDSFFKPLAEATLPEAGKVDISPEAAQGFLIKQTPPLYPPIAKAARVQGTVILQVLIGKDGRVLELGVESGPPMLQQAALDAVQQWIYKPYVLNADAVEVMTTVQVVFTLDLGPQARPAQPAAH